MLPNLNWMHKQQQRPDVLEMHRQMPTADGYSVETKGNRHFHSTGMRKSDASNWLLIQTSILDSKDLDRFHFHLHLHDRDQKESYRDEMKNVR
jgi:hypothetical protein